MAIKGLNNLCTPAMVYLVISISAIVIMLGQNYFFNGNTNVFCVGAYSCTVSSIVLIFTVKLLYVLFWTWILNLICSAGAPEVAWFLVLLPFILMFILLGLMMV
jgi:hypothetical protein